MSKERVSFSSLKNKMAKFVCVTRRCCANLFQGHIPKALKASVSHIVMQNHFEHPLPKFKFTILHLQITILQCPTWFNRENVLYINVPQNTTKCIVAASSSLKLCNVGGEIK